MKNNYRNIYNYVVVSLLHKLKISNDGSDIQIAYGSQTPSAAGQITLWSINVPVGAYCIIGDVDYYAGSGKSMIISYVNGEGNTIERFVRSAASFVELPHDFDKHPFMAALNTSPINPLTISATVDADASVEYTSDAAYVIRSIQ